jgi:hypothetical protein
LRKGRRAPRSLAKARGPEYGFGNPEEIPMATATMESAEEMRRRISELNLEHRDLDRAIEALELNPLHDELQLKRLKKRKLMLKDQITRLESELIPDLNA